MVDNSRPVMHSIDFKDFYKHAHSMHYYADIVLIDKTTTPLEPILYQLDDLINVGSNYQAFTELGLVDCVETQKKLITLADGTMVNYHYLIIASGPKSSWMTPKPNEEFAAGVQILMEALRLQEKKPPPLEKVKAKGKIKMSKPTNNTPHSLPKPATEKMDSFSRDHKRIYQVQL